ncbi:hypothetical protein PR003_g9195 [Phytophthora rubi]|uniref:Secreted protein n=1 Tax=Phytophthora rubi TaxID=129364 RepID=A0A6A3MXS1_9STRA|nr:hypothetical protein PR002_g16782 [Phytophthora rubi]KAE9036217.1 hypothetical protein PR001_g8937 [Phytophthora rubi]KAE9342990.1 hypothetical protein PR003_g9195 [Phytophthora rubi]
MSLVEFGTMFTLYVAVIAASTHISCGSGKWFNIHRMRSDNVLIIRSATPFCSGVRLTVVEYSIPYFFEQIVPSFRNSLALSLCSSFIRTLRLVFTCS